MTWLASHSFHRVAAIRMLGAIEAGAVYVLGRSCPMPGSNGFASLKEDPA